MEWLEFGFVVEGSEFERYGKKALDISKWDWQIGRRPANDSDEDEEEEEEGRQQVSQDQTRKRNRIAAGLFARLLHVHNNFILAFGKVKIQRNYV